MNTKSHSIEEMAIKLKKLNAKKVKLDESIVDMQSQLDEALKTLGINQKITYRDNYPTTYIPYQPFEIAPNTFSNIWSDITSAQPSNFTSATTFDV